MFTKNIHVPLIAITALVASLPNQMTGAVKIKIDAERHHIRMPDEFTDGNSFISAPG